ncbi:MAG: hypothetical protein N2578_03655 [Bdellovibrionaceae bacterium]|nr:hypothetical protein [Pseudobdellovibrionaceae bacterium]
MAKSVYAHVGKYNIKPGTSFEEYKVALRDMLCPASAKSNVKQECVEALRLAESGQTPKTYSPFRGPSFQCDFKGCAHKLTCRSLLGKPLGCDLVNTGPSQSTTFVDEYLWYLKAFSI